MKNPAAKLYRRNLLSFVEKAFRSINGKRLEDPQPYLSYVVHAIELLLRGDIQKLLINLPGRHLKTFICSVCFPAFALGFDPTLKFLTAACAEDLAEDIVRQIREVMESSWYKSVFDTRISPKHSLKNDFNVVGGGRVRAVAIRNLTGKGGDIIIFDDPHNAQDWDNTVAKEKVISAFELLISRRDGGAKSRMLVVGHRVAEDDLSAHILDRGDFKHVCIPLVAPKAMTFDLGDGQTLELAKGEALQPDAFPPEEIKALRRSHRGSPFFYYYMQGLGPRSDEYQIESSHFPFFEGALNDVLEAGVPVVLSVDPAQKTFSSSRNVVQVYAVLENSYLLLQVFAERCSFDALLKKIKKLSTRYRASALIIENTARGPDLIEKLTSAMQIPIHPVNPQGTKSDRLRKCASIIRANKVLIRSKHVIEEAVDEIVAFPYAPWDDNVDAMTNFLLHVKKCKLQLRPSIGRPDTSGIALAYGRGDGSAAIGFARGYSFLGQPTLPDFSNNRPEAPSSGQTRRDPGRPFCFSFDGKKVIVY